VPCLRLAVRPTFLAEVLARDTCEEGEQTPNSPDQRRWTNPLPRQAVSDPPRACVCIGRCPSCSTTPSCLPPRRVSQVIFQEGDKSRQIDQNGGANRTAGQNRLMRVHVKRIRQLELLLQAPCRSAPLPRCCRKGYFEDGENSCQPAGNGGSDLTTGLDRLGRVHAKLRQPLEQILLTPWHPQEPSPPQESLT
jgi:hypothetical protein